MSNGLAVLIVIGLSLVGVLGDYFIKLAGDGEKYINVPHFIIGTLVFASTAVGWFFAMKYLKLGTIGVIYAITTVVALTLVGILVFKEAYTWYEMVGIGAGILSVILLARFA